MHSVNIKLRALSLAFISLICFPELVFGQRAPNPSSPPATKLVPPATGKIRVAFV
jgi:hypothetical protein